MTDGPRACVQALVQAAASKMMPNLDFVIAVPEGGGVCADGQVAVPAGHLVMLKGRVTSDVQLTSDW